MHYQLFIPHTPGEPLGTAPQALERLGLSDLIAGHEARDSQGPGEFSQGHLVAWRRPGKNERMHYNVQEQTWIPSVAHGPDGQGKGRYWVGFWNDSPVTPDDLLRPYSHRGETVEFGDGQHWRLPILQELPRDIILADDGTWKFELQRRYHDLVRDAEQILKDILAGQGHDFGTLTEFVLRCMNQNYRVLPEVASHLRLFSTENIQRAVITLLSLEAD